MSQRSSSILGVNCAHDASACLMIGGEIRVAIPEERLIRVKHYEGFPHQAIDYCLQVAGLSDINNIDCIVMNQYAKSAYEIELQYKGYTKQLLINPSHHLLHAYYAYLASGFEDAAVLIVDGSGYHYGQYLVRNSPYLGPAPELSEMEEAESLFHFSGGSISLIEKRWGLWHSSEPYYRFPSLGHMFSVASQYIFGNWIHAGKTMGLAPYGDSTALPFRIVSPTAEGLAINIDWMTKLPRPTFDGPVHQVKLKRDVAAKVQAELEEAMLYLVARAHDATQCANLCFSGGVALNSVANGRIIREGPFKNVFVTPAANDTGIAIGAALYGHHQLNQVLPAFHQRSDFFGRVYDEVEIAALVQNDRRAHWELVENSAERAAADIAAGKIVGWFEGKSEFGPRALGHRSILCDPRPADMKDQLNARVKFRESFRPYAASVLEEYAGEYFDINVPSPYMLVVASIHPEKRSCIPAVCHVDGTCRIQTVDKDLEGRYRQVIEHFYERTGVPLVLNTSFNVRGEPIVETPQDAFTCFASSGMDILYLGPYRISKIVLDEYVDAHRRLDLIPCLNERLTFLTERQVDDSAKWGQPHAMVQTRTGYRLQLDESSGRVLELIDGQSNGHVLLRKINQILQDPWKADQLLAHLGSLQQSGLVSFVAVNA